MEPRGYAQLLESIKTRVREARVRVVAAASRELVQLYWHIGREILERQGERGWGAKVIERLSRDIRREFPGLRGFEPRNLQFMRAFARAYPEESIVKQVVSQIPWGHNVVLLGRVKEVKARQWYAREASKNGWSRNVLIHQIESDLYGRQGRAITNFARTLPPAQSDLAQEVLRDPYPLGFLGLSSDADERTLEKALISRLQRALVELGYGIAFVGRQVRLEVGGEEFYLDLLFYHLKLRCFLVVELKAGPFRPEHAGKMNFYLTAVDEKLRHAQDGPSLGMILCRSKNKVIVEYSLRAAGKPIGVATYTLEKQLPRDLRGALPGPREIERILGGAA